MTGIDVHKLLIARLSISLRKKQAQIELKTVRRTEDLRKETLPGNKKIAENQIALSVED